MDNWAYLMFFFLFLAIYISPPKKIFCSALTVIFRPFAMIFGVPAGRTRDNKFSFETLKEPYFGGGLCPFMSYYYLA